ncbi:hypothetical protein GUJ93_ZPchr0006g42589 [Zizania palustris]|uniref:Uncharacterized protein n=1 Tax=Zizania palustris TaxID=103762 RepID=A0A8J5SNC4_ZIZPA|nr:hypothetical protein GUJ93_ZPchr0006g42589 [Zizania palustris]
MVVVYSINPLGTTPSSPLVWDRIPGASGRSGGDMEAHHRYIDDEETKSGGRLPSRRCTRRGDEEWREAAMEPMRHSQYCHWLAHPGIHRRPHDGLPPSSTTCRRALWSPPSGGQ